MLMLTLLFLILSQFLFLAFSLYRFSSVFLKLLSFFLSTPSPVSYVYPSFSSFTLHFFRHFRFFSHLSPFFSRFSYLFFMFRLTRFHPLFFLSRTNSLTLVPRYGDAYPTTPHIYFGKWKISESSDRSY